MIVLAGQVWPVRHLPGSGVIFAQEKVSLKRDSSQKIPPTGFRVRHMAATVAISTTASMLISSGITGLTRGVTKKYTCRETLAYLNR
jgi:hypothetical protein